MRWLSRLVARASTRLGDESGVTIIFIAVVLLGLLAMTAFVIDFGRIWQERRELQTGATAAALAVAEDCARDLCDAAGYSENDVAKLYADANATDGVAAIHGIALDLSGQTVEVVTATEEPDGSGSMDMFFARIIGFDTITVGAGATVEWGYPTEGVTIPLIFSECEWLSDELGNPGENPDSLPDSGNLIDATMVTIEFHAALSDDTECTTHPGLDLPGGWGWLDTDIGCTNTVTLGQWENLQTGNSTPGQCGAADFQAMLGEVVLIPYYDETIATGNKQYKIAGFSPFFVTGYRFISSAYSGFLPPYWTTPPCSAPTTCLSGYFVSDVDNGGTGGPLGGSDRGFTVIQLIG